MLKPANSYTKSKITMRSTNAVDQNTGKDNQQNLLNRFTNSTISQPAQTKDTLGIKDNPHIHTKRPFQHADQTNSCCALHQISSRLGKQSIFQAKNPLIPFLRQGSIILVHRINILSDPSSFSVKSTSDINDPWCLASFSSMDNPSFSLMPLQQFSTLSHPLGCVRLLSPGLVRLVGKSMAFPTLGFAKKPLVKI